MKKVFSLLVVTIGTIGTIIVIIINCLNNFYYSKISVKIPDWKYEKELQSFGLNKYRSSVFIENTGKTVSANDCYFGGFRIEIDCDSLTFEKISSDKNSIDYEYTILKDGSKYVCTINNFRELRRKQNLSIKLIVFGKGRELTRKSISVPTKNQIKNNGSITIVGSEKIFFPIIILSEIPIFYVLSILFNSLIAIFVTILLSVEGFRFFRLKYWKYVERPKLIKHGIDSEDESVSTFVLQKYRLRLKPKEPIVFANSIRTLLIGSLSVLVIFLNIFDIIFLLKN